jgi:hypothetical protein
VKGMMIDVAEDPTAQAEVAESGDTELSPSESPTEHAHAWALDDGDEGDDGRGDGSGEDGDHAGHYEWRPVLLRAAAVLTVFLAGVAAIVIVGSIHHGHGDRAATATPSASVAPPSPATPASRADDQLFLRLLKKDDLLGDPEAAPGAGVGVCRLINAGEKPGQVAIDLKNDPAHQWTLQQAEFFVADAIVAYCPHAGL